MASGFIKDIKGFYIHVKTSNNSPLKNIVPVIPFFPGIAIPPSPLLVSSSLI
jgi:hypothetical protein